MELIVSAAAREIQCVLAAEPCIDVEVIVERTGVEIDRFEGPVAQVVVERTVGGVSDGSGAEMIILVGEDRAIAGAVIDDERIRP